MMEKRCRNCDAYNEKDKFCYKRWWSMTPSEYCSQFVPKNR